MKSWYSSSVLLLVLLALLLPNWALAQADTGSIEGRIFDESRAPLPGATVTAKNLSTGLTRSTISSAIGTYRLGSLPAGDYDVSVELTGFYTQTRRDKVLATSVDTLDFTLVASTERRTGIDEAARVSTTTRSPVSRGHAARAHPRESTGPAPVRSRGLTRSRAVEDRDPAAVAGAGREGLRA